MFLLKLHLVMRMLHSYEDLDVSMLLDSRVHVQMFRLIYSKTSDQIFSE